MLEDDTLEDVRLVKISNPGFTKSSKDDSPFSGYNQRDIVLDGYISEARQYQTESNLSDKINI